MSRCVNQPSEELAKLVGSAACYGIEWALSGDRLEYKSHYNPEWRIKAVEQKGLKGLYTTASKTYSFARGEGLVGKAFAKQQPIFVKDIQEALIAEGVVNAIATGSNEVFQRKHLAEEFGIHSVYFLPSTQGVLEIGTTETVESADDLTEEKLLPWERHLSGDAPKLGSLKSPNNEHFMPEVPASNRLKELVELSPNSGACYGIEWAVSESGCIVHKSHYNPQWRIEAVGAAGLKSLYTSRSSKFRFMPGQGYVGKAFAEQQTILLRGISSGITWQMSHDQDQQEFIRHDLAKEYGIESVVFMPHADGVFEIGTTNDVASVPNLILASLFHAI